jgi:uncharacterized peroxidase-related enzyme
MSFIQLIPVQDATGDTRAMYERARNALGHVPNYTFAFCWRPEVMSAWGSLISTIKGNMNQRRYELVTLAAARALKNPYCSLAHGSVLRDKFFSAHDTEAIARDPGSAGVDAIDLALMDFARKVALDASTITQQDIDELHDHGVSEQEIFDVATAAAARAFFTKVLAAVGAQPDDHYTETLESSLYQALADPG